MNLSSKDLLKKAQESLDAARLLLEDLIADYRGEELSANEAQLQIDRAEEFLNLANQLPHME